MANSNNEFGPNEVNARLAELIFYMSEAEKRELLKELEKRHQAKLTEKRKHPRKSVFS